MSIFSISIDYAVLGKSDCIKKVSANFKCTEFCEFDAIINYFDVGNNVVGLQKQTGLSSYSFSNTPVFTNVGN